MVTIETDRDGGIDIDNKDNTEIVVGGLSTYKDFTLSVLETAVGVIICTSNKYDTFTYTTGPSLN
jgi:hypothetical protein